MTFEAFTITAVLAEWGLGIAAATYYFTRARREPFRNTSLVWRLFIISVVVFFSFALMLTFFQYFVWKEYPLSQNLLPPYQSILYFAKYTGTHFWLAPLLSLIVSGIFYAFLKLLKRKNERFFEEGETELGALAAFLVGWPRIIVFLPVVFLAVVVISGIKMALHKSVYTTLGLPFLVGLAIALACGYAVLQELGLESLAVILGAR